MPKQHPPSRVPTDWPTVTVPINPKDVEWLKKLGQGSLVDGIQALVSLYWVRQQPNMVKVYREEPSAERKKAPIYQAEG